MQYKELFFRTYNILRFSSKTWQTIVEEEDKSEKVINDFIIPLAAICALSAFLGVLFQSWIFEKALVSAIITIGKSFGSVFLSFFLLQETMERFFNLERNKVRNLQLVGYSYAVIFALDIIANLIPDLFFLRFFKLYVVYVVWEGVEFCTKVQDNKRVPLVLYISALILLSCIIIEKFLLIFMPNQEIIAG